MKRRAVPVAAAALLALASCIDLHTDPHEIVAIEFQSFPWPSIVAGDTLRDASGHAVPLVAKLFDASGAEVTGQTVDFLSRDTTVSIASGNFLVAHSTATSGTARLLASGAGLQTGVRQIELVPRPDSIVQSAAIDTLRVQVLDSPTRNVSSPLAVKVFAHSSTGATPVRAWIVSFAASYHGTTVPAGDTTGVYLVDDAGRPSSADTTDTQGIASRKVRWKSTKVPVNQLDSVVVTATASYRGALLAGAPVRMVLPAKP